SRNLLACACACGRKLRVARSTLEQAPILCGACEQPFEPAERDLTRNRLLPKGGRRGSTAVWRGQGSPRRGAGLVVGVDDRAVPACGSGGGWHGWWGGVWVAPELEVVGGPTKNLPPRGGGGRAGGGNPPRAADVLELAEDRLD